MMSIFGGPLFIFVDHDAPPSKLAAEKKRRQKEKIKRMEEAANRCLPCGPVDDSVAQPDGEVHLVEVRGA